MKSSSGLCLSQQNEDQPRRETNRHPTASSISKPSSVSITIHQVLVILPHTLHVFPWVLPQLVLSQLTSLCKSARIPGRDKKLQCIIRSFFSMESPTNGAQLYSVRRTSPCVLLVKNPSPCGLACFHLCLLQGNVPS